VTCIAVIAGDGAGKTTLTRRLLEAGRLAPRAAMLEIGAGDPRSARIDAQPA